MIDAEGPRVGQWAAMIDPPDTTTRDGAEALARKLDAYWHAKGFPQVRHWAELQRHVTAEAPILGSEIWVVRSNLVRGQPPRSMA